MRVTIEHYNRLFNAIRDFKSLFTPEAWQEEIRRYQADERFKDWRVAFTWAVFHSLKHKDMIGVNLGNYSDAHIDTALRKAFKALGDVYP